MKKDWFEESMKIAIVLLLLIGIVLGVLGISFLIKTLSNIECTAYEEYIVSEGETLWDIACNFKKDKQDVREYVYQIRMLNNIDDCIIREGQVIKIIK